MRASEFQEIVWQKGRELYRDMPWRQDTRPYYVMVSEIMLQQTQVERVKVKFAEFIRLFPDIQRLAAASLAEVLAVWSGLGYNRRAKYLHEAAKQVVARYDGQIPSNLTELTSLPGIGINTAGAIMAYSFNQPVVFIETNIRTVMFRHFFADHQEVSDSVIRDRLQEVIDRENPREFYWALMDYGTFLKRNSGGQLEKSKHYKKQAPLKGSLREVRGMILKALVVNDMTERELAARLPRDDRYQQALDDLIHEGLVTRTGGRLHLAR